MHRAGVPRPGTWGDAGINSSHSPACVKTLRAHFPGLGDVSGLRIGLLGVHYCPCPGTAGDFSFPWGLITFQVPWGKGAVQTSVQPPTYPHYSLSLYRTARERSLRPLIWSSSSDLQSLLSLAGL